MTVLFLKGQIKEKETQEREEAKKGQKGEEGKDPLSTGLVFYIWQCTGYSTFYIKAALSNVSSQ